MQAHRLVVQGALGLSCQRISAVKPTPLRVRPALLADRHEIRQGSAKRTVVTSAWPRSYDDRVRSGRSRSGESTGCCVGPRSGRSRWGSYRACSSPADRRHRSVHVPRRCPTVLERHPAKDVAMLTPRLWSELSPPTIPDRSRRQERRRLNTYGHMHLIRIVLRQPGDRIQSQSRSVGRSAARGNIKVMGRPESSAMRPLRSSSPQRKTSVQRKSVVISMTANCQVQGAVAGTTPTAYHHNSARTRCSWEASQGRSAWIVGQPECHGNPHRRPPSTARCPTTSEQQAGRPDPAKANSQVLRGPG